VIAIAVTSVPLRRKSATSTSSTSGRCGHDRGGCSEGLVRDYRDVWVVIVILRLLLQEVIIVE